MNVSCSTCCQKNMGSVGEQDLKHREPGAAGGLVAKSCLTLVTSQTIVRQAPLSLGLPRQEYWSGLPFPSLEDLSDPGIEPWSPALQVDSYSGATRETVRDNWSNSALMHTAYSHKCPVLVFLSGWESHENGIYQDSCVYRMKNCSRCHKLWVKVPFFTHPNYQKQKLN